MIVLELKDLSAFVDDVLCKVNAGCLAATRKGLVVALPETIDFEIQIVTDISRQIPTQLTESHEQTTEAGQGRKDSQNASVEVNNQTEVSAGGEASIEVTGQTETSNGQEGGVENSSQVEASNEVTSQVEASSGVESRRTNDTSNSSSTNEYEEI